MYKYNNKPEDIHTLFMMHSIVNHNYFQNSYYLEKKVEECMDYRGLYKLLQEAKRYDHFHENDIPLIIRSKRVIVDYYMTEGEKEKENIIHFPEEILQSYMKDMYKYTMMEMKDNPTICLSDTEKRIRNITYKCYRPSLLSKRICDEIFGEQPSLSLPPPKKNVWKMLIGMAGITTAIFMILWFWVLILKK